MLYANTDDGSSALWVCDGSGVVVDNISYSIGNRAPILEQINEHYGTSFTGWSDNEIGLRVGETIPDWSAYEKIEQEWEKYVILLSNDQWMLGQFKDGIYRAYEFADTHAGVTTNGMGEIIGNGAPSASAGVGFFNSYLSKVSLVAESVISYPVNWEIGGSVPEWDTYSKIE